MSAGGSGTPESDGGLLTSLPRLLVTIVDLLRTRLAIASTEFEEERERLRELVVYGFWSLVFASLGLILTTLFAVMALWDTYHLYALGGFAALYLFLGLLAALRLRRSLRQRSRLFATTLDALHKDRAQLDIPK